MVRKSERADLNCLEGYGRAYRIEYLESTPSACLKAGLFLLEHILFELFCSVFSAAELPTPLEHLLEVYNSGIHRF